jgi:nitrite reductase/ring-hydroxylating ferredoxin subunit
VARWYTVGRLADIAVGSSLLLETDDGHAVAVWRLTDGRVFATDDQCSHYFWSLHGAGTLNGTEVKCLGHEARFDVTTGAALCPPARLPLATYDVVVDDNGQVLVRA